MHCFGVLQLTRWSKMLLRRSLTALYVVSFLVVSFASAKAQEEAFWSNWAQVGALKNPTSDIELANGLNGVLTAAVIGSDGAIYMTTENSAIWNRFAPPPGTAKLGPMLNFGFIANADGRLQVFIVGSDGRLWTFWQVNRAGGWSVWTPLFERHGSIDQIVVGRDSDGAIEVLLLDNFDSHIYRTRQVQANSNFTGQWDLVDRGPGASLLMNQDQSGRLELATVGVGDGLLYVNAQTSPGSSFGSWQAVGSKPQETTTQPAALVRNQDGRLEFFTTSIDNTWHTWQDGNDAWSANVPWAAFGTPENATIPSVDLSFGTPLAMRLGDGHLAVFRLTFSGSALNRKQFQLSAGGWAPILPTLGKWTPWDDIRLDPIARQGIFPDLTGGMTQDGRASIYTVANLSDNSSDRFVFRIAELTTPQKIPPPGSMIVPSRTLEIRNANAPTPYTNPTCEPTMANCFPIGDSTLVKDTCAGSTWLGGSTKWEWISMLDRDEQVERRPVAASGWAFQNAPSDADIWFTHPFGFDFTYSMVLDAQYQNLSFGTQDDAEAVIAERPYYAFARGLPQTMHIEMDGEFEPVEMRPQEGDRVAVIGKWNADCGHTNYQTEIHPPLVQAAAHAVDARTTDVHIVGRPLLANQNYGGKTLLDHFALEVGRAALPIPAIAQFDAFSDTPFNVPFSGVQQFDLIVRPPTPQSDPSQTLLVKSWLYTRPGVTATFFSPESGAVGIHVIFNSQNYVPAPLPSRKTVTITVDQLRNANGAVDEFIPVLDGLDAAFPILGASPFIAPIISRGILSYDYPTIGSVVPAPQQFVDASTVVGTQAQTRPDITWPIFGDVTVAWSSPAVLQRNDLPGSNRRRI
jgi:hypothetical protein